MDILVILEKIFFFKIKFNGTDIAINCVQIKKNFKETYFYVLNTRICLLSNIASCPRTYPSPHRFLSDLVISVDVLKVSFPLAHYFRSDMSFFFCA